MAYKILFFLLKKVKILKEIGEGLKDARENIGLTIEEVSNDLKLRPSQVENIESGNVDAFKDIFFLKSLIKEYSKYLGLNYEEMVDEFNEYLFDKTSKISLDDIKKAKKKEQKKIKKEERIASPYTIQKKDNSISKVIGIVLIVCLLCISIWGISKIINNEPNDNTSSIIE